MRRPHAACSFWAPRKIVAPPETLAPLPALLRPFIRFAHAERMIPAQLTADTLAAVERYEPEYQELIRTPRHQGPMALLDRMGLLAGDEPFANFDSDGAFADFSLRELVGEVAAPAGLDAKPLPNERFDWSGIPDDVHDPIAAILTHMDRACDRLLDREYRTAARRFLADVARADPAVFRVGKPENSAAAVIWVIGKANDVFDRYGSSLQVSELLEHFGLRGSVSQRANRMLAALGIQRDLGPEIVLGDARYLVGERRAAIMAAFGLSAG